MAVVPCTMLARTANTVCTPRQLQLNGFEWSVDNAGVSVAMRRCMHLALMDTLDGFSNSSVHVSKRWLKVCGA